MASWTLTVLFSFIFGVLIRVIIFCTSLPKWLQTRNEVVTPLTSWERVEEGIALQTKDISPYSGDIFHETPLLLRFLSIVGTSTRRTNILFLVVDIIIGIILVQIGDLFGRYLLSKQNEEQRSYSLKAQKLILRVDSIKAVRFLPVVVHFLNPFSIAACVAKSTAVFTNLAVLLAFLYTVKGNEILSLLFVAVATYLSLYPATLFIPAAIYLYQYNSSQPGQGKQSIIPAVAASYTRSGLVFVFWLVSLFFLSYLTEGSWNFLLSTYGFILTVPDLAPNIGFFWYFFIEMFEHFRTFFLCVFQINAFVYTVPLAIKLRNNPVFFMYMLVCLMSIFKSYPSYADTALYFSLLPLWRHTFLYMRNKLLVACFFLVSTVFAPILYHLWIYSGSANANFYFAITLCYSSASIFLMQDILYSFLRREYDLKHGCEHKLPTGEDTQVILS